jgi:hypothetical protein
MPDDKEEKISICQKCGEDTDSSELHSCPYQSEINDNEAAICNCCDKCRQECVWDI